MVFSSSLFLFIFLPILLVVYFFAKEKYHNTILLIASLIFYAWGEPKNIILMILAIIVNYYVGIGIEKYSKHKKKLLVFSLIYNIGVLYIFKYLNFTVNNLNAFFSTDIHIKQIALPIGISFFTFQIMSYILDVYWGNVKAQHSISKLALYISLFPQLIAGPIVRYIDVEKQIDNRNVSIDNVYYGLLRFSIGFSKKILIADRLAPLADMAFANTYPSMVGHWAGIIAYTLQIYFDFSGYSDMAIGLGRIFGFNFLENFNYPYISKSIKEFWRRWHISLSTWFRDYLYIPLGGSRCSVKRAYINLIIVFFITGFWHGASFNFIAWGLFYVIFLIIERAGFGKILEKLPSFIQHIYSLLVIVFAWVFFRADSLTAAVKYMAGMFTWQYKDLENFAMMMNNELWFFLALGIFFSMPHPWLSNMPKKSNILRGIHDVGIILVFIVAVSYMLGSTFSPFLYFRF